MEAFEQLERGESAVYGVVGSIWVMIVHRKPSAKDMLLARLALATMKKRHPAGFPTLTWITISAGLSMDDDARKATAKVTEEFVKEILVQATLIEGTGFQAATVRAIVAGLDAMARSKCPKKVFGEVGPAITWCAEHRAPGSPAMVPAEATRALGALRELFGPVG